MYLKDSIRKKLTVSKSEIIGSANGCVAWSRRHRWFTGVTNVKCTNYQDLWPYLANGRLVEASFAFFDHEIIERIRLRTLSKTTNASAIVHPWQGWLSLSSRGNLYPFLGLTHQIGRRSQLNWDGRREEECGTPLFPSPYHPVMITSSLDPAGGGGRGPVTLERGWGRRGPFRGGVCNIFRRKNKRMSRRGFFERIDTGAP